MNINASINTDPLRVVKKLMNGESLTEEELRKIKENLGFPQDTDDKELQDTLREHFLKKFGKKNKGKIYNPYSGRWSYI